MVNLEEIRMMLNKIDPTEMSIIINQRDSNVINLLLERVMAPTHQSKSNKKGAREIETLL